MLFLQNFIFPGISSESLTVPLPFQLEALLILDLITKSQKFPVSQSLLSKLLHHPIFILLITHIEIFSEGMEEKLLLRSFYCSFSSKQFLAVAVVVFRSVCVTECLLVDMHGEIQGGASTDV